MAFSHSVTATAVANRNVDDPTISITTVSGDTLLCLGIYIDDTTEGTVSSVSDDQGNTWVLGHSDSHGTTNQECWIYYVDGPAIAATTITVTTSAACDTVLAAVSFQGPTRIAGIAGDTGDGEESVGSATTGTTGLSLSCVGDDGVIIAMAGHDNNHTPSTYGTGQNDCGNALNGGAEKYAGAMTYEIYSASGTNEQQVNWAGTANGLIVALELRAEPVIATRRIFVL